jgi:hypothetical protein
MYRAFAEIHVEHSAVGSVQRFGLPNHLAVHYHQPDEVLFAGQQWRLEGMRPGIYEYVLAGIRFVNPTGVPSVLALM